MENKALKKATMGSISEILETMFFMPSEFSEKKDLGALKSAPDTPLISSSLSFTGPVSGTFAVVAPLPLAKELAANLLGLEPAEVDREEVEATVKELLNMVAGKSFALFDKKSVFNMGVPDLVDAESIIREKAKKEEQEIIVMVETVEGYLAFLIKTD